MISKDDEKKYHDTSCVCVGCEQAYDRLGTPKGFVEGAGCSDTCLCHFDGSNEPPPDAERVTEGITINGKLITFGKLRDSVKLKSDGSSHTIFLLLDVIQQLRAREEHPLYSVDSESGKITRIDKPLDLEKVTALLDEELKRTERNIENCSDVEWQLDREGKKSYLIPVEGGHSGDHWSGGTTAGEYWMAAKLHRQIRTILETALGEKE